PTFGSTRPPCNADHGISTPRTHACATRSSRPVDAQRDTASRSSASSANHATASRCSCAWPTYTPSRSSPARYDRSPAFQLSRSDTTIARRSFIASRPICNVYATDDSPAGSPSRYASRSPARPRSAASVRPDSTATTAPSGNATAGASYSSTTMCAFEPPAPNDDSPATRGPRRPSTTGDSHGRNAWFTVNGPASKSICGFNRDECSDGTTCRWRICNSTLVSPAMPAAASA
ncbi:hypothetical protein KCV01_g22813, partial [Aureobasidium melanogenum]